jgi:DNA-directed RNA polymerase subunit RPC12/RpoP
MGYKSVCIECRKSLNRPLDTGSDRLYPCSECGKPMTLLSHRFRPPKKSDDKKWETVKFLIENGFHYDHVYQKIETNSNGVTSYQNYATYPDNIRDAKEFVEKYKEQARK